MLIYKNNPTLPQGGPDIGLKVGILAEIGNMLHECAVFSCPWPPLLARMDGQVWSDHVRNRVSYSSSKTSDSDLV